MTEVCACLEEIKYELRRTNELLKWLVVAIMAQSDWGTISIDERLIEVRKKLEEVMPSGAT